MGVLMNWGGQLQNLLLIIHIKQIICGPVRFSVPEETEPGTLIGSLSNHFPPPYQLLNLDYLWMDTNTGNIYTTELKLDREALCPGDTKAAECFILHNALVGPSANLIQFLVIIEDINDNAPHFENTPILLRIPEDVAVGTDFTLDDQARDQDVGLNGALRYDLEGSGGAFTLKVDEEQLLIKLVVQAALDRETQDMYQMQLVAMDCGIPSRSASALLIVTVTDVNDNCPKFSPNSTRSVTIRGDSPNTTQVAHVIATDLDAGPNAVIFYSFSPRMSERAREILTLDSQTGHITLTHDLKSESPEELFIQVFAHGPHCPPTVTQVTLSLLPEVNQELVIKMGFIAEHRNQTMLLPENQPPAVLAVLELEGDSGFEGSSLAIEDDVPFSLSPQNGKYLLSTSKHLDYEMRDEYLISVAAHVRSAEGSLIIPSRRTIRVSVVDVNDNAPCFSQPLYRLEVEENNRPGATLLQVSASDADSGPNGKVTYRLDKHSSAMFNIDSRTGQLSVGTSLDRERQPVYELTVFALDGGSPPLESQARVCICLLDQNDNAPIFSTSHFIFFTPENVSPLAEVGKIAVEDPDEGENGTITVRIVNSSGLFRVDKFQRILTTSHLDREVSDHHELYLEVSDNGRPAALTSSARVTIFVEDVNDNPPKVIFPNSNSSCLAISLNTPQDAVLTKIYAIDDDSGLNSDITYSMVGPIAAHSRDLFQVDSRSGVVTLSRQLQSKNIGMHHMFVVIRDNGKPTSLYSTVWLNVLVNDSITSCNLDKTPTWKGMHDLIPSPTKALMCDVGTSRSSQVVLIAGLSMILTSVSLFSVTVGLFLKHRRSLQQGKGEISVENGVPLGLRDQFYSDE